MVGVTGSAGKTTTSWLVRSIFEELGQLTGMLGARIGPSCSAPHVMLSLACNTHCSRFAWCLYGSLCATACASCAPLCMTPLAMVAYTVGSLVCVKSRCRLFRAGSLEYAIAEDRMTDDGNLWVPLQEDTTLKRCGVLET